jgi:uncharacterized protein (DUF433 family)
MLNERVFVNPHICHGKPTIKGTRIMVVNVLSLFAGGYNIRQILDYYPELTEEDVKAAVEYAISSVQDEEIILTKTS